ncbi:MAG: iron reductase, partial [Gammaproteobacteria bacterium]|nr:iron reductase [Gammaproteobacteria bacterium]
AAQAALDLQVMLLSEEDGPGWRGLLGRLDRERLTQLLAGLDPARSVALICGPGPMITVVSDLLLELGMPMDRVVYERFDYASGSSSRQDRRRMRRFIGASAVLALGLAVFVILIA